MTMNLKRIGIVALLAMLGLAIAAPQVLLAQDEPPAAEGTDQPAAEEEQPDPYAVPDGTPQELAVFIGDLMRNRSADGEKRRVAVNEAADKILAAKPGEAEAGIAVQGKIAVSGSVEDLEALAKELKAKGFPKFVRMVQGMALQRKLSDAARTFGDDRIEKIKSVVAEVRKYLASGELQGPDVRLAMMAGQIAEYSGDEELAVDTYRAMAKLLAKSEDEQIAAMAERLEGVIRRLTLVGNKMKVEGTLLDGTKFDWSSLRGKVVLVDFWATWCGPCVAEVPNMKKVYEAYKDLGFEIVGISLDRDREQLEKFLADREIPWTIVYDGGQSETANYYGVMGIPTMVLVDKTGTVVSTKARGPQLKKELEALLGPVEEKPAEEEEKAEEDTP